MTLWFIVDRRGAELAGPFVTTRRARLALVDEPRAVAVVDDQGLIYAVRAVGYGLRWGVTTCDRRNEARRRELGLEDLPKLGGSKGRRFQRQGTTWAGRHLRRAKAA